MEGGRSPDPQSRLQEPAQATLYDCTHASSSHTPGDSKPRPQHSCCLLGHELPLPGRRVLCLHRLQRGLPPLVILVLMVYPSPVDEVRLRVLGHERRTHVCCVQPVRAAEEGIDSAQTVLGRDRRGAASSLCV